MSSAAQTSTAQTSTAQTSTAQGSAAQSSAAQSSDLPLRPTLSIERLLSRPESDPVPAGAVVAELFNTHRRYLGEGTGWAGVETVGPSRTVAEHVAVAARRWDPARAPVLSGQLVILGLALDDGVAWPLLTAGVVAAMLARWTPGRGTAEEPYRLVWDLLNDEGSALCESRPLLAAAFGAPPEWTVELPARPQAVCWSPAGDSVAVLADGVVYEAGPDRAPHRIRTVPGNVVSLAWGAEGVLALTAAGGEVEVVRAATGASLVKFPASGGRLSADGSRLWLGAADGVQRWSPPHFSEPEIVAPAADVLAVDGTGLRGLVAAGEHAVLVGTPGDPVPGPEAGPPPWSAAPAAVTGWGPPPAGACALVRLGRRTGVARATDPGVAVGFLAGPAVVARLATGTEAVTSLAADLSGRRLVVASGRRLSGWTLAERRLAADRLAGFDSDRAGGEDLLDADRDARALAALIASQELQPPLTVGVFGAWGSGKSFLLGRIERMLGQLAVGGPVAGYLDHMKIIHFNAWHYAETNLWASLVDKVLRGIGPTRRPAADPQVVRAGRRAAAAAEAVRAASAQVEEATTALAEAQRRLDLRRRNLWLLGSALLLLAAIAVVAVLLGGAGRVVAAVSAALALLGAASGALAKAQASASQARELAGAGQAGVTVLSQLIGRPEEVAVRAAALQLTEVREEERRAREEAEEAREEAERVRTATESGPLGVVLDRLSTVTEYHEQLGLVARTRERFADIDQAVTAARARRAAGENDDGIQLDRVVIVIDDLDRCPAEKVVTVLEAVHLLFDFPMFVVVLAVDTRWLDQSLRIRYRQLLGRTGSAAPSDYLEKIIQVPVQLVRLDKSLVRKLITGLVGSPAEAPPERPQHRDATAGQPEAPAAVHDAPLSPTRERAARAPLPAEVLTIGTAEAAALSAVAALVGRTPRTVKRFVNTYRLLKARSPDPAEFGVAEEPIGDHEVVAFLTAVLVGPAEVARPVFAALARQPAEGTLQDAIGPDAAPAELREWLAGHPRFARAPARSYAGWAAEVARFAFGPP